MISASAGTTHVAAQQPQGGTAAPADPVARGKYIVEDVAMCGRCHSPVDEHGERDRSRWLRGGAIGMKQAVLGAPEWPIVAPRLAGAPPGTDAQFIVLMMTGVSRTGAPSRQPMPQFRLTQADAEAVLAYLKSLGAPAPRTPAPPAPPTLTRK